MEIGNHYYQGLSLNKNIQILPPTNTYAKNIYWVVGILIIYFVILYRCIYLAIKMQDTFSRLITAALAFTLFSSSVVNIAMVSGLLPVVGAPLPFISYGGTSMVVSLGMIGIIMSLNSNKSLIAN